MQEKGKRDKRKAERQEVYNTKRWKTLRDEMRMRQPLCQDCLQKGIIKPMEEVHHIKSFCAKGISPEEKEKRAYDINNLVCLCKDCHIRRHHPDGTIKDKLNKYDF